MMLLFICVATGVNARKKPEVIKVTVEPKEASIYINNTFYGYGYAEFMRPKKKDEVMIIRCECEEYKPILTKFYGGDKRSSLSFMLNQDGFYRASAASGIVNKFFTIDIDSMYYTIEDGKVNVEPAWKLLHQILLTILKKYQQPIFMEDIYRHRGNIRHLRCQKSKLETV